MLNDIKKYPEGWNINLCIECNEFYEYGQLKPMAYFKAFNLLMEYYGSLPDEDKTEIDKQLKKIGL